MSHALATSLLVVCLAAPAGASCAQFSWELAGTASDGKHGPLETRRDSIQATYNFGGVDDSQGPYALATFLDPKSRMSLGLGHFRFDQPLPVATLPGSVPGIVPSTSASRESEKTVGGRYVFPQSKWYAGGGYATTDIASSLAQFSAYTERKAYGLVGGKYLGPRTSLEVTLDSYEARGQTPYIVCVIGQFCANVGTTEHRLRSDRTSIDFLHVATFRALRYSLSGRIASTRGHLDISNPAFTLPPSTPFGGVVIVPVSGARFDVPQLRNYSVGGELFPTSRLGIRVGYTRWDDDTAAEDAYDVAATWFFSRNVGLRFAYARQRTSPGLVYTDTDFQAMNTSTLGVIGRF